jgi:nucleotide-binding universal stress UspA family protein
MIRHILHPTDLSYCAEASLPLAIETARRHQATLHVLHVGTMFGDDPLRGIFRSGIDEEVFYRQQSEYAEATMDHMLGVHDLSGVTIRKVHARGTPAEVILNYTADQGIDIVVMGTHGRRGIRQLLLGSVAQEVMRRSPVPVMVVRAMQHTPPVNPAELKTVLACVDFSQSTGETIRHAAQLAEIYGASLELLHIVDPVLVAGADSDGSGLIRLLAEARVQLERAYKKAGVNTPLAAVHAHAGYPPFEITEFGRQHRAGLLVLGRQGISSGFEPSVGLTADYVVRALCCPLVVVPGLTPAAGDGMPEGTVVKVA